MDFVEEVGESSSPPRGYGGFGGGNDVYNRLIESGNGEATSNPDFREQLEAHFNRLPPSYGLDINMDRVEDVLLHQKLLARAKDPDNQPVFHIRFLENVSTRVDLDGEQVSSMLEILYPMGTSSRAPSLNGRNRNSQSDLETCSKLEILNLEIRKNCNGINEEASAEDISRRQEATCAPIHEVIFSTFDKPKLLSQLSALLSDIGLNIREAHVFSTTDGFSLDVFVVDGWHTEDTEGLYDAITKALVGREVSCSASTHSHPIVEKSDVEQTQYEDWEIDWRLLKIGKKIAVGSCGDLYRGVYLGQDVAIKVLRSEHLNNSLEVEFAQEVAILRQVVKVADFGVARFQNKGGVMTAETGTYRWMAPEVINHQPYDQKADVFSFGIVLWELVTSKVPYDTMTPLQAALGVRQGLRPELPRNAHPKLIDVMQRCWGTLPNNRPSFNDIRGELEELLLKVNDTSDPPNGY